ncbi:DMT family transporter [Alteriqipengyuania flavescens]|uniref:DMT family transporter n=1 Tax=Alteriqipengyuania flavescens TaxID=3053610 RepID=UPI0025B4AEA1|nr:DMT family transporter [Alteriqipengyuania flavescens]WJY17475.1 DMT family transporter [Alteriqipengyuania flavescens]WJY23418.1 DMT family transporter [Alteriqipengyuania flavescens]
MQQLRHAPHTETAVIGPVLMALLGVGLLALIDALMKSASLATGVYTAAFLRVAFASLIAVPLWLAAGGRWPKRPVLKLHALRGVVSAFMALTFFFALTRLPIAETIAISFVAPIVALYLARVFLGEAITRHAVAAALLGLAGTFVILSGRLGSAQIDARAWAGIASILVSAMLYAVNFILIRRQSLAAKPLEIAAFHGVVQVLVLALAAPFLLHWPDSETLTALGGSAALTVGGALAIAWAYARAETQVLVPMEYSGFLWAALFGWLFFAERVEWHVVAGAVLIVAGCLIAARRKPPEITAV